MAATDSRGDSPGDSPAQARALLRSWFQHTLAALAPAELVRAQWPALDWEDGLRLLILALGKAAAPMMQACLEMLPAAAGLTGGAPPVEAVLVVPAGTAAPPAPRGVRWQAFEGGHPYPNAASLDAAAAMLQAARRLAVTSAGGRAGPARLLALISGGGSALAELPLCGGLEAVQHLYRALVRSGAPIGDINTVRKHHSAFKGGQLAAAAAAPHVEQISWILSDVPGGDLSAVASGPTCPDLSTLEQAQVLRRRWLPEHELALQETPKPGAALFARSQWHLLADNGAATAQMAALARAAGCHPVVVDATSDEWESAPAAGFLATRWRQLRAAHVRPCLIAGGEVRVRVPAASGGRGGRNQDLALRVAQELAGEEFCFLSAGTDGVDGVSTAAGACVDGGTVARARAAGCEPGDHLARFDAEPLLAATGDLIYTGPTGNNLRDLRVFL